jgi:hypothetical protein
VMVPGRPNISLTITWALDYDPVEAVKKTLERNSVGANSSASEDPGPEGSGGSFDSVATDYGKYPMPLVLEATTQPALSFSVA